MVGKPDKDKPDRFSSHRQDEVFHSYQAIKLSFMDFFMKTGKVSTRTCVGCHQGKEKSELIRIVRTPQGEVILDPTGKAAGRGAYICADSTCFKQAIRKKALSRSLGIEVSPERLDELEEEFKQEISRSQGIK